MEELEFKIRELNEELEEAKNTIVKLTDALDNIDYIAREALR